MWPTDTRSVHAQNLTASAVVTDFGDVCLTGCFLLLFIDRNLTRTALGLLSALFRADMFLVRNTSSPGNVVYQPVCSCIRFSVVSIRTDNSTNRSETLLFEVIHTPYAIFSASQLLRNCVSSGLATRGDLGSGFTLEVGSLWHGGGSSDFNFCVVVNDCFGGVAGLSLNGTLWYITLLVFDVHLAGFLKCSHGHFVCPSAVNGNVSFALLNVYNRVL